MPHRHVLATAARISARTARQIWIVRTQRGWRLQFSVPAGSRLVCRVCGRDVIR